MRQRERSLGFLEPSLYHSATASRWIMFGFARRRGEDRCVATEVDTACYQARRCPPASGADRHLQLKSPDERCLCFVRSADGRTWDATLGSTTRRGSHERGSFEPAASYLAESDLKLPHCIEHRGNAWEARGGNPRSGGPSPTRDDGA